MGSARSVRVLASALVVGSLSLPSAAQGVLHELVGITPAHDFGVAVAGIDDLDGDGFADLAVGASLADTVRVYSGASGALLFSFTGNAGDGFGRAVALAGDFDRDGVPDLVVGAPQAGAGAGRRGYVQVFSGATGVRLLQPPLRGLADGDAFGFAVAAGDLDADGLPELVVGAPQNGAGAATGPGYVMVVSPLGTSATVTGQTNGDLFGFAIAVADILSGAGDDLIVGAPQTPRAETDSGYVQLIPGSLVGPVTRIGLATPGALLGHAVAAADVDGDGQREPILGAPHSPSGGAFAGRVTVFLRAGGSAPLTTFGAPGDQLGFALARIGDTDGDGVEEFVAGAPQRDPQTGLSGAGYARVFSGATALFTAHGEAPGDALGFAVAGAGDINGNGLPDSIAGAPQGFPSTSTGPGYVRVYAGRCGMVAAFGTGCAGSGGFVPMLCAQGCPTPRGRIDLSLDNARGGSVAAMLLGGGRGSLPLGVGCTLLLEPLLPIVLGPLPLGGSGAGGGSVEIALLVPLRVPVPATLTMQGLVLDAGAALGFATSGGVEVTVR